MFENHVWKNKNMLLHCIPCTYLSDAHKKSLLKSSIVEDRQACRATCHLTRSTCQWVIPTVGSCLAGTQYRSSVAASVPLLCVGPYWVSAWWAWCARVLVLCWGPSGLLAAITSLLRFSWSVTNLAWSIFTLYIPERWLKLR